MKKVEAIIRSSKFKEVREALATVGVYFFTFLEVKGYGHQKGESIKYRGTTYDMGYIARLKLEILIEDEQEQQVISIICDAARTGEIGDGKISISNIETVVRVRTGESGPDALN